MRIVKKILAGIGVLLVLIIVLLVSSLVIDSCNTSYLKKRNVKGSGVAGYVIKNVNIIPMSSDTVLEGHQVKVVNGEIGEVGTNLDTDGLPVIDGQNRYLLPGLIDMHVHVWDEYELGLYLANGVTAVRNVWGMPMHLKIKKKVSDDKIISPVFFSTGPKMTGPEFIGDDNLQNFSPEEARSRVESYKGKGYDFIKTYYGLTPAIFDAVIDQAGKSGLDIVAHPSQKVPYSYHFNPQIVTIEHAEDIVQEGLNYKLDSVKLSELVNEFSHSPFTSFCPTLIAFYNIYNMLTKDQILSSDTVQFMNASIRRIDSRDQFTRWSSEKGRYPQVIDRIKNQHSFHLFIIRSLHEAGVNIICGTDAGIGVTTPGFSIHQEMGLYKDAGLSNYEVLKTATINVSKTHAVMNNMGVIEKGKMANFIIVSKNPLENLDALKNPDIVIIKGRKLDRQTLDGFLNKAKGRKNFIPTITRYLWSQYFN